MTKTPRKQQTSRPTSASLLRVAIGAAVAVAGVWVLVRNWGTVQRSLQAAQAASPWWLSVSVLLMAATFWVAAGVYGALALHRLRYKQTVLVEVATAFVNKLLPAGVGALGLHGVYLYKRGHTAAEATAVVSMNNLIGMSMHWMLLLLVAATQPSVLRQLFEHMHVRPGWWALLGVLIALLLLIPSARRHILRFVRNLLASLRRMQPRALLTAAGLAALFTAIYTTTLFAAAHSVGVELGWLQVFIIFSIGMLTATATPTPGGLVGAEAGLFAGFVAYGVPAAQAGAATLLYRLVSYWLPLLPGAIALAVARRRKIV